MRTHTGEQICVKFLRKAIFTLTPGVLKTFLSQKHIMATEHCSLIQFLGRAKEVVVHTKLTVSGAHVAKSSLVGTVVERSTDSSARARCTKNSKI